VKVYAAAPPDVLACNASGTRRRRAAC
jgi:hypothetical protein